MSTPQTKSSRPWQFRLIWLFVGAVVVAFCCVLWLGQREGWAILLSWVILLLLTTGSICGTFFLRGYSQAFFLGMAVPQTLYALDVVGYISFVPLEWDRFVRFVQSEAPFDDLGFSFVFVSQMNAGTFVLILGVSLIGGVLAVVMRWFAINSNARQS